MCLSASVGAAGGVEVMGATMELVEPRQFVTQATPQQATPSPHRYLGRARHRLTIRKTLLHGRDLRQLLSQIAPMRAFTDADGRDAELSRPTQQTWAENETTPAITAGVSLCRRGDLNPHGISPTSTSS